MSVFEQSGWPAVVGHRGVRGSGIAENTPDAFAAAAAAGADWIELDARRSADAVLVVCHDGCTPDQVPVVERTAQQLRASGIHALSDVLERMPAGLGVNIEVKNLPGEPDYDPTDAIAEAVASTLGEGLHGRPLLLSSFNPLTVAALVAEVPDAPVALVHYDAVSVVAATEIALEFGAVALVSRLGAEGLDAGGFAAAHAAGLDVMVWTVNDTDVAVGLAEAGADAICTDDPGALRAAFDARRPG